jgi:hypothetical protein
VKSGGPPPQGTANHGKWGLDRTAVTSFILSLYFTKTRDSRAETTDLYIAVSHKMSNIMGCSLAKAIGSSENTLLKPGNAIGYSIDMA